MRTAASVLFLLLAAVTQPALARQGPSAPQPASHPPEVALVDEGEIGSVYRETTMSLRLYTNDADPPGKSTCNDRCRYAWPPLRAPANAAPVGEWTIIDRDDTTRQWAFRGKPVYTRFHDAPDNPTGVGFAGWRLIPYMSVNAAEITRADALAAAAALWNVIDANEDGVLDETDRDLQRDQAFARIDTDKNRELSREELGAASPHFRTQQDAVRAAWFVRLDVDGNGGLSRAELATGGAGARPQESSAMARQMFRMADTDNDGRVARAEFDAMVGQMLARVDTNNDGKITKVELEAGRALLGRMIEAGRPQN